jgi:hypothetical protein
MIFLPRARRSLKRILKRKKLHLGPLFNYTVRKYIINKEKIFLAFPFNSLFSEAYCGSSFANFSEAALNLYHNMSAIQTASFQGTFPGIRNLELENELKSIGMREQSIVETPDTGFNIVNASPMIDDPLVRSAIFNAIDDNGWTPMVKKGIRTDHITDYTAKNSSLLDAVSKVHKPDVYDDDELFDMFVSLIATIPEIDGEMFTYDALQPDPEKLGLLVAPSTAPGIMPSGYMQEKKRNLIPETIIGTLGYTTSSAPPVITYNPASKLEAIKAERAPVEDLPPVAKNARWTYVSSAVETMMSRALFDPVLKIKNYACPWKIGVPTNKGFGELIHFELENSYEDEEYFMQDDDLVNEQDFTNYDVNIPPQSGIIYMMFMLSMINPRSLIRWGNAPAAIAANYVYPVVQISNNVALKTSILPSGHYLTSHSGSMRQYGMRMSAIMKHDNLESDQVELCKNIGPIYGDDFLGLENRYIDYMMENFGQKGMICVSECKPLREAKFLKRMIYHDQEKGWLSKRDVKDICIKLNGPGKFKAGTKIAQIYSMIRDCNDREVFDGLMHIGTKLRKITSFQEAEKLMEINHGGFSITPNFEVAQMFHTKSAPVMVDHAMLYERAMKYNQ